MSELSEKVAALEAELAELRAEKGREFWICFDNSQLRDAPKYASSVIEVYAFPCPSYCENCVDHWDNSFKVKIDG